MVGDGPASTPGRPTQLSSRAGRTVPAAAAVVAGVEDTQAGLADAGTTLADGSELFVGRTSLTAEGPAFALPPDDPTDPPDFAAALAAANTPTCLRAPLPASRRTAPRLSSCRSTVTAARIPCRARGR